MPDQAYKRCSTCRALKPRDEYYSDRSHKDGLTSRCRECDRARGRAVYAAKLDRPVRPIAPGRRANPSPMRLRHANTAARPSRRPTARVARRARFCSDVCRSRAKDAHRAAARRAAREIRRLRAVAHRLARTAEIIAAPTLLLPPAPRSCKHVGPPLHLTGGFPGNGHAVTAGAHNNGVRRPAAALSKLRARAAPNRCFISRQ